ncbi:MAG: hypothetical protein F9K27_17560 [Anaerolineae bacterium]|nr:MAG: hypothetical protein F9K27_17560 [Anaerolineae bacterium]
MTEWWYRRAEYNQDDQTYTVLHDDGYRVTYSFVCLEEDDEILLALQKKWEDDSQNFELYPFRKLEKAEGWQDIVTEMVARAQATAPEENVDEFLCLIDIAKRWAVEADLDDELVEEMEGLFEAGPADAYTYRMYDPDRLHHHVERPDDECWQLGVARVVSADDPTRELGWVSYAIHYPELVASSDENDIARANQARLLDLEHHIDEVAAQVAALHLDKFMRQGSRVQDPEYAYMNDTFVLECISVLSHDENDHNPTWQVLSGDELRAFREKPVLHRREWYPRDLFRELTEEAKLSPGHVDQMAAMWRDLFGIKPHPFKEDSPFEEVDL